MRSREKHHPSATLRAALAEAPVAAAALGARVGVGPSQISRLLARMRDVVLVLGRARATRYVLRRAWAGAQRSAPLYEVDPGGGARHVAQIHGAGQRGFYVESRHADVAAGFYEDLPYFLYDMRPAGFLGRRASRQVPALALPDDVRVWSGDHCMAYFATAGARLPGALLVGDDAFATHAADVLVPPDAIEERRRGRRYDDAAEAALAEGPGGSSAAGEQPKFCATLVPSQRAVIVKFSPPTGDALAQRWRDLLVAEHLALETLAAHGRSAARSGLVDTRTRRYLEVERFDRAPRGGRQGVISLFALDCQFVGRLRSWNDTAARLREQGIVDPHATDAIAWLAAFGALIANDDMHLGNLSMLARGTAPTVVAPAYDMLPALYAPRHGQVTTPAFVAPVPTPARASTWRAAAAAAADFWRAVAADGRVSADFRALAAANADQVARVGDLANRMS